MTAWLDAIDLLARFAPDPALPAAPWRVAALAAGGALLLRVPLLRRRALALAAGGALVALPVLAPPAAPSDRGGFSATVLDVGHGVSTLLRLPDGATWLVDGGGRSDGGPGAGRTRVLPALRAAGVRRIDVMVMSHGHADHAAGLVAVAVALPVGELWTPGPARTTSARRLERAVRARGGRIVRVSRETPPRRHGGTPVAVLWPPAHDRGPPADTDDPENDRSVVLRVGEGPWSLLLPGDIEAPVEARLAAGEPSMRAAVLVAPHHGSATSSTPSFVAAVAPRVVVWSRGPGDRPALPAPAVARRYRRADAYAFDTAVDGKIEVRLDEGVLSVCSGNGPVPGRGARCHALAP